MSVCGENGDSRFPGDDLKGASRAMARESPSRSNMCEQRSRPVVQLGHYLTSTAATSGKSLYLLNLFPRDCTAALLPEEKRRR